MIKRIFFFILAFLLIVFSAYYYFFAFQLKIENATEEIEDSKCSSSSGKVWEIGRVEKGSEKFKTIFLDHGDQLVCSFETKKLKSSSQLVVGYFDETVKNVTIKLNESNGTIAVELKESQ